ncbi:Hypothetical Protein FCC1311_002662 [Hondaea fermentalgiana]|uniref:Uncharacterized protein n=1 Tax=Hondaea fermentalgiana TaxID=2315210 RepID=A0A2R5G2T9_9STRA|nr:Hypothetical Protein FCC1311_002662 [Hondaea fermentalgiana]|eukprot:GBG24048.1 Hypothetical Protein FCC1311_002662 [Hondaea fermentalgiana]
MLASLKASDRAINSAATRIHGMSSDSDSDENGDFNNGVEGLTGGLKQAKTSEPVRNQDAYQRYMKLKNLYDAKFH